MATELDCSWYTVNKDAISYGQALSAVGTDQFGTITSLWLDERVCPRHDDGDDQAAQRLEHYEGLIPRCIVLVLTC